MGFFPQFFRQTPVGKWTSGLFQAKVPLRLQGKHLQEERHHHPVQYRTKQYFQTNTENIWKSKSSRFFKIFIFSFRFCCPPFVSPKNSTYPFLHPFCDISRWNPHIWVIWVIQKSPFFSGELHWNPQRFSLGENHVVLPILDQIPWNPQIFLGISSTFFPKIPRFFLGEIQWTPPSDDPVDSPGSAPGQRPRTRARPTRPGLAGAFWMAGPWEKHGKSMGKAWEDGDFTRKNGDLMGCRADFLLEYHCNNYGMWKLELL